MLSRRWAKYVALVLLIGMLVPTGLALSNRGSDGATPEEVARQQSEAARQRCVGYARSVARQLQTYVARFDASVASAASAAGGAPLAFPSVARLRDQVAQVTGSVGGNGCDPAVFRAALAHGLGGVRGTTDLGSALASTLVANVRDVLDPGSPRRVQISPGDDLLARFDGLPSGSTLVLAAGTYRIDRPLVVLQDVTLRGAGRGKTRIVSTSADAAVLQAAPVRLGLRDLEVRHTGAKVASVLLLRAGTTVLDRVSVGGGSLAPAARASAATVPDLTSGGNGVVALSSAGTVLRDVRLEDNEAGGLVAAGRARPRISGSTMTGNALCGACFLGRSAGVVTGGVVSGNGVGLIAANRSRPRVAGVTFSANRRAGLVSQQDAAPQVSRSRFEANGDIGIALYNGSDAVLRDNTVSGHRQVGIVVSTDPAAAPKVLDNVVRANARAGIAFLAASRGTAVDNRCSGGAAGLVLGGTARPQVSGGDCPVRDERTG